MKKHEMIDYIDLTIVYTLTFILIGLMVAFKTIDSKETKYDNNNSKIVITPIDASVVLELTDDVKVDDISVTKTNFEIKIPVVEENTTKEQIKEKIVEDNTIIIVDVNLSEVDNITEIKPEKPIIETKEEVKEDVLSNEYLLLVRKNLDTKRYGLKTPGYKLSKKYLPYWKKLAGYSKKTKLTNKVKDDIVLARYNQFKKNLSRNKIPINIYTLNAAYELGLVNFKKLYRNKLSSKKIKRYMITKIKNPNSLDYKNYLENRIKTVMKGK